MKKFSVVALAMTATLALGACSAEDEPEEATTSEASADEGTEETTDEAAETGDMGGATDDAAAETGDAAAETGDAAGETEAAGGEFSEPACNEFFTEGGPLADRAEAARSALDAGEVADTVAYSELMLLKSRLDTTAEEAPEDISALITTVNAPFAEVVDLVNEGSEDVVDAEAGTITLPEIDTQASADAQAELETACAG
ncbi:hypothetical protein [Ornithinimicrobium faecis]|uniref:Lipoprotein n=1 Tax=Ornithinimicrobium faecis TaxID=2934158 RepID=A0ABY4YVS9_9MICO|nr:MULTISPECIES: hypothetical protein [unclassified Ornithinimicrobium]USQ80360.1 hypothetical protein NF556_01465 [Ornithinimicrobium sp. HY1793]